jgi:LysR family nitrogen assimilation transcriptional regulator
MDFRQMRSFLAVLQAGSISRAAERLGIAQPALGVQIRHLEAELGVTLLHRLARGVQPTEAGERFAAHATHLLAEAERVRSDMADFTGRRSHRFIFAMSRSSDQVLAGRLAELCRRSQPDLDVSVVEAATAQMRDWLVRGRIDAALTFGEIDGPELSLEALAAEELCFVVPAGGADAGPISLRELVTHALILPKPRRHVRVLVEQAAKAQGLTLRLGYEIDSFRTAREFVRRGMGSAVLPLSAVREPADREGLMLRSITAPALHRTLRLATMPGRTTPGLAAMLDQVRALATSLTDGGGSA